VFFFGGGWKNGNPRQFEPHCRHLAAKGMVAITADYRVSSRHDVKLEDCVADARSAMRWVRGNAGKLGIDPGRIAAGGGSAGGHLAAAVALMDEFDAAGDDDSVSAEPDAMVLFNPALAIAPDEALPDAYNAEIGARLRNRSHGPVRKVSPLTFAAKKQAPCIMFFGTADKLLAGAEAYRKESTAAGNECRIVTYDGQGHGFFNHGKGDNKHYDLTVAEMDRFLEARGFLPAPRPATGARTGPAKD
ncbi:MAG: alpha/beta hydrolase, partial [Akkermansiaceae bacterium]|nr:alpha/beta hydrolase [Akkermansiaceae bacterium]